MLESIDSFQETNSEDEGMGANSQKLDTEDDGFPLSDRNQSKYQLNPSDLSEHPYMKSQLGEIVNEIEDKREISDALVSHASNRNYAASTREHPSTITTTDRDFAPLMPTETQAEYSIDEIPLEAEENDSLESLQAALPGLPLTRLKRINNEFKKTLGYPSILRLVPLLRETMPDDVTNGWLKKANTQNAEFVFQKARDNGLVDVHMLNAMLEFKASVSSLDVALAFHGEEFEKYKMVSHNLWRIFLASFVTNCEIWNTDTNGVL